MPAPDIDDEVHAGEVVGGSERGVPVVPPLPYVLIEDRRGLWVLFQVGEEGHLMAQIKGGPAGAHPFEELAPGTPNPGRPPIHRHRPQGLGRNNGAP
jgi:hypothetical protein